jgi:hypothetical protein
MRTLEPARAGMRGVKSSRRREHARGLAAPHYSQVPENVGETASTCTGRLRPGESPMRNFANEGHSAIAVTAQGFTGDGPESVTRTIMVPDIFVQLFLVPATGSATGLPGGAMHIAGSERAEEGHIP